jgi:hypothetical protein
MLLDLLATDAHDCTEAAIVHAVHSALVASYSLPPMRKGDAALAAALQE